jgi:type VI secretion system protein ImpG
MKSRYFDAELAYLREQGREFAERYPQAAGLLAERSDDPDVERLLEGFAFLAASVRERADDAVPELAQLFATVLVPALTRFVPPVTILQFRPEAQALREHQLVPRGSPVSGVVKGVRCLFRTTADLDLLPLSIEDVVHTRPKTNVDELTILLRSPAQLSENAGKFDLRLHLHGSMAFWTSLRGWMLRFCKELTVVAGDEVIGRLDHTKIRSLGFTDDERLFPERPLEHDAFSRVAEWFAFPEKFSFVQVPAIGRYIRPSFALRFRFENAPKLPRPPILDDVRLHCVPVVNLFEATADPINYDPLNPWALVRVAGYDPGDSEVWDITSVDGINEEGRWSYPSFGSYEASPESGARFYTERRRRAAGMTGTNLYLSVDTARDVGEILEPQVLSCELLATNRATACALRLGDLSQPVRGCPTSAPFANISAIQPPLYPHDDVELVWRLASHLALSRRQLHDADNLRRLLRAYNFAAISNPTRGSLNEQWIASVRDVLVEPRVRVVKGAPITGTRSTVVLDGGAFASPAEALIFGEVLDDLFARRVSINSFNEFVIRISPSGEQYGWPPKNGKIVLA